MIVWILRDAITCALRRERVAKAGDWGTVNLFGSNGALCAGAASTPCIESLYLQQ